MRLFGKIDGQITRMDTAVWLTRGFDLAISGTVGIFLDPFSAIYADIYSALKASALVTQFVNIVAMEDFTTDDMAIGLERSEIIDGDLPRLIMVPAGVVSNLQADSSASSVEQQYQLQVLSGEKRLAEIYFPLKWAILKVIRALNDGTTLSKTYLQGLRLLGIDDREGGLISHNDGWEGLFTIVAMMNFDAEHFAQETF